MENNKNKQSFNIDTPQSNRNLLENLKDRFQFDEWTGALLEIANYSNESPSYDIALSDTLDIKIPSDTDNQASLNKQANFIKVEGIQDRNSDSALLSFTFWDKLPKNDSDIIAPEAAIILNFGVADKLNQTDPTAELDIQGNLSTAMVWTSETSDQFNPSEMLEITHLPQETEEVITTLTSAYTASLHERLDELHVESSKKLGRSALTLIERGLSE